MELDYEIVLNAIVYVALVVGLVTWRRQRLPKPATPEEAFQMLEASFRHAFPDIKDGFTLEEGMARAKRSLKARVAWEAIEKDLNRYEAYRYGGGPVPQTPGVEFLRLVKVLGSVRLA